MIKSGVYRIRNSHNGKSYVGSATKSIESRWVDHRKHLRGNKHHSRHLQQAWNRYGEDAFVFEVIVFCDADQCLAEEQKHIDAGQTADRSFGYNISPTAGNCRGVKASPETILAMSMRMKGKRPTAEARAKMSAAATGKKKSPAAIQKTASAHRGRQKSAEHKAKLSAALRGRKLPDEHIKASADARRGLKLSEEHKQKLSEAGKQRPQRSAEWSAKIAAANAGKVQSPELIAKRVAAFRLAIERRRAAQ